MTFPTRPDETKPCEHCGKPMIRGNLSPFNWDNKKYHLGCVAEAAKKNRLERQRNEKHKCHECNKIFSRDKLHILWSGGNKRYYCHDHWRERRKKKPLGALKHYGDDVRHLEWLSRVAFR